MKGTYTVNKWEGRVSVRFESESSTTVYMDETVGSFESEEEALEFASSIEAAVWADYKEAHTCPHCGYFSTNHDGWCYCGEEE